MGFHVYSQVSIHALAGSATRHGLLCKFSLASFNPRTRGECDLNHPITAFVPYCFNPRTRGECDDYTSGTLLAFRTFQSTHSRGVRQNSEEKLKLKELVSIHALAGSATKRSKQIANMTEVSIHALAGSATISSSVKQIAFISFNPRTRGECDMQVQMGQAGKLSFNPRTRGECDYFYGEGATLLEKFQSTHSRGVRPVFLVSNSYWAYVSIHALAGSATLTGYHWATSKVCFNPRTRGECDLNKRGIVVCKQGFQSTHSRGVRPL